MSITLGPIYNAQKDKIREWSVTISLYDADGEIVTIKADPHSILVEQGYYVTYATCSGYIGRKMTISAPTQVSTGKNIGKKNATNVLTQALKECQSKYATKIKAGYSESVSQTKAISEKVSQQVPFPMAVKTWKDHQAKLEYPLYIQPKLDGVRMLAKYMNGDVVLYTRRLHNIGGFIKIKEALKQMFEASKCMSFIIDGELYAHGSNLQTISSIVRNESIVEEEKEMLQYHVFDCFDTDQPLLGFKDRLDILSTFVESAKSDMIVFNDTVYVKTAADADEIFMRATSDGYEGIIYKSADRPYEFNFNKEKRSGWYLKRKKKEDAEFPIVGFTQGKGKDSGCIVFKLQGPNKKTFNCVPNGMYEYRKQLFEKATKSFAKSFKGKLAKVVYDDLSKDGIPLRGRIVQIGRDLSFD